MTNNHRILKMAALIQVVMFFAGASLKTAWSSEGVVVPVELVDQGLLLGPELSGMNNSDSIVGTVESCSGFAVTIDGKEFQLTPNTRFYVSGEENGDETDIENGLLIDITFNPKTMEAIEVRVSELEKEGIEQSLQQKSDAGRAEKNNSIMRNTIKLENGVYVN